jgi:molybdenum cofactor biosynthesis protein B
VSRAEGAPGQHRAYAPRSVGCLVLTVSDTRTPDDDTSGKAIAERLEAAGHIVVERRVVRDEPDAIRAAVLHGIALPAVDAVIATGGTGVSPRDSTPEVVEPLLEKVLHGFGELFRALSFAEIGPAAMLSRALAGTAGRTAVFVTPGSSGAVRLALDRLILPELPHLVGQLRR